MLGWSDAIMPLNGWIGCSFIHSYIKNEAGLNIELKLLNKIQGIKG
jgi:hypothetical protein